MKKEEQLDLPLDLGEKVKRSVLDPRVSSGKIMYGHELKTTLDIKNIDHQIEDDRIYFIENSGQVIEL